MTVPILVGAAANGLAPIEAALGGPVDSIRDYGWIDNMPQSKWVANAKSGYTLHLSCKFRLNAQGTVPATDIWNGTSGKYDAQIREWAMMMVALASPKVGKHVLCFEHEEDAKAAQGSGNTAQLNAAIEHCKEICNSVPGFSDKIWFGVCWTGYDIANREPALRASGKCADVIMIDPYGDVNHAFSTVVGPEVDYIGKTYGADFPIIISEWGAPPAAGLDKWLNQWFIDVQTPRFSSVVALDYWNSSVGSFTSVLTGTALTALANGYRLLRSIKPAPVPAPTPAPVPTPAPTTVTVPISAVTALESAKAAYEQAVATYIAAAAQYQSQVDAAQAAAAEALATLNAAIAVNVDASPVTLAATNLDTALNNVVALLPK
jgi:hypothetical protein